jgi:hypothetical protein
VIRPSRLSQNPIIITSGEEGGVYSNTSLEDSKNEIINDLPSSSVLAIRNATGATALINGNKFYGLTTRQIASGPHTLSKNTFPSRKPTLIITHPWSN